MYFLTENRIYFPLCYLKETKYPHPNNEKEAD